MVLLARRPGSESVNAATPAHAPLETGRATLTGAWAGLTLYASGFLLVAARFLAGAGRTLRMVRLARTAAYAQAVMDEVRRTLGMGARVRALESPGAAVPMTWGTLRPVVLLPEEARHWSGERLHAV